VTVGVGVVVCVAVGVWVGVGVGVKVGVAAAKTFHDSAGPNSRSVKPVTASAVTATPTTAAIPMIRLRFTAALTIDQTYNAEGTFRVNAPRGSQWRRSIVAPFRVVSSVESNAKQGR
jgi:hypothetical protein